MLKFLIRRILMGILIIFFGAFIVYAVLRFLPASFVEKQARMLATNVPGAPRYQDLLAQLNALYGMDKNVFQGYMMWFGNAIQGNFGDSWLYGGTVVAKFKDVIWYSVALNFVTLIVQLVTCIPLGILAARKQYSKTDYFVTVFALIGLSLPSFFLATMLKYVFSIQLGWLDLYGMVGRYFDQLSFWGKLGDMTVHMIMPVITLAMLSIGGLMRYTRTNMLEVLNSDYIRTARAKGLSERIVINRHAFRNTLIPLVTYMSYLIPSMFAGSMITEILFQIPGIGYISFNAIVAGDIPFTMFYSVLIILLTQVSLIVADIMYAVVDPRVRIN